MAVAPWAAGAANCSRKEPSILATANRQYSGFFTTLYDEPDPRGEVGRGSHYSVFGSFSHDVDTWRIAVIWDEDHDIRVVHVVERLHLEGLLKDVIFVGERKGSLSLVRKTQATAEDEKQVEEIASSLNDPWTPEISTWPQRASLIHPDDARAKSYLENIAILWKLLD